jgi:hypothetical protein
MAYIIAVNVKPAFFAGPRDVDLDFPGFHHLSNWGDLRMPEQVGSRLRNRCRLCSVCAWYAMTFVCREQTDHPRRAARPDYSDGSNIRARIFHVWIPYQPSCSISVRSFLVVQIFLLIVP